MNSLVDEVYHLAEIFSELKTKKGVFGVLGNHDFYTSNVEIVAKEIEQCSIKLLRNEHFVIENGTGKLFLLGVDDFSRRQIAESTFKKITSSLEPAIPKVLMRHRPYFFQQAVQNDIDLALSGHTHERSCLNVCFPSVAHIPFI